MQKHNIATRHKPDWFEEKEKNAEAATKTFTVKKCTVVNRSILE